MCAPQHALQPVKREVGLPTVWFSKYDRAQWFALSAPAVLVVGSHVYSSEAGSGAHLPRYCFCLLWHCQHRLRCLAHSHGAWWLALAVCHLVARSNGGASAAQVHQPGQSEKYQNGARLLLACCGALRQLAHLSYASPIHPLIGLLTVAGLLAHQEEPSLRCKGFTVFTAEPAM